MNAITIVLAVFGTISLTVQKADARAICGILIGCQCVSPLVIDTTGNDFQMTSAENGVFFDIWGDGSPMHVSWTAAASGVALLALDRNGNGIVDDGKELFGTATAQPVSSALNGFAALAEFDKAENGGNEDGVIDQNDAIYSRLLLWLDENHDGFSQPGELHRLADFGLSSISLDYRYSRRVDEFGNAFAYRSRVTIERNKGRPRVARWMYDVFLTTTD